MRINKTLTIIALTYAACASIILAQLNLDNLKQRILAQAQSVGADDYAFTRTIRSVPTANGKTETTITVDKYDPTKSGDARWTLVSVDGVPPSTDELSKYRKETPKRRVPGYHRLANYFAGPVTAATDSRARP